MKITPTDVTYVAELANLEVPEEERAALAGQLSRIVDYVEQLEELDTDRVQPTAQVVAGDSHVKRADRIEARAGTSEAAESVGLFRVPRVIDER